MSDQKNKLQNRLVSLDVFRGITIAGMILVNNPGSWSHVYPPLRHAEWNGWTPTDFIFPFFLFIVGVAMAYSFDRYLQSGQPVRALYPKIIRRTLILFGLGLFLHVIPFRFPEGYNWFTDTLFNIRIPGVLQRIAVVYFFTSVIMLHVTPKHQYWWGAGMLVLYWLAMKLIPFSVQIDGQWVQFSGVLEKEINLAAWLDDKLLHGHTWIKGKYLHHDPEGFLSTIPAIVTALTGVWTGRWVKSNRPKSEIANGLFFAGCMGVVSGSILALGFPINKYIWSPSYVVFMGGMALLFLAVCYYAIDIRGRRRWSKPFVIFGTNSIALFVGASAFARVMLAVKIGDSSLKGWLYQDVFSVLFGPLNGSLAFAVVYIVLWLGVLTIMYRKNIFLKI